MSGIIRGQSPWVPDGVYTVKYCGYETNKSWNSCKVLVHFAIVEGDYEGIPLTRYYNASSLIGPAGDNGLFEVTDRRAIVREFRRLLPEMGNKSELDLNAYGDKLIRARVETIEADGLGKEIPTASRYSVIREPIKILPDDYSLLFEAPGN